MEFLFDDDNLFLRNAADHRVRQLLRGRSWRGVGHRPADPRCVTRAAGIREWQAQPNNRGRVCRTGLSAP